MEQEPRHQDANGLDVNVRNQMRGSLWPTANYTVKVKETDVAYRRTAADSHEEEAKDSNSNKMNLVPCYGLTDWYHPFLPPMIPLERLTKAMALFRYRHYFKIFHLATIQRERSTWVKAWMLVWLLTESRTPYMTMMKANAEVISKMKKEIEAFETINIELEHIVAKLLKENKTLKRHYKDLYDSIKIMRSKTIEQTTSLLANNADLKAQIHEKVFAIVALKNYLRKLKGNSVDTKFTKTSVLGKLVSQSLRNQSIVRQPNAFKSERPQMSKPLFASQVDVNHNLSRPVTQHYLPKRSESSFLKPNHMIASSSSRNNSKNLPRFSSNDMVHNHYLDEDRKKTQERDRNSKTSVMPSARFQSTADDSKPKPRSTNHSSRSLSCVFNANHDTCITNFLKEVNSRAKVQSNKTRNSNKPVEQKHHTQKPIRQIFIGHRFSPNKTSAVYEKTSPRSDLRWKPTGRIFNTVGLRWVPTRKILASCTSKDDSELTHGSNIDIPNIHEHKQTLDLSVGTSINVQKEQSFDFSAGTSFNVKQENLRVWLLKKLISRKLVSRWIHK
ncbi:hypothetical protein Tco_0978797 [Tanacetum coccineum]|uniref:Uncharacterized protein n=1 Tax=Tanacetum coccineum TaxID=301880 RepID=A0ABQ5EP29_9ASTR